VFDLRREITATAAAVAAARSLTREPIVRADSAWRVLETVARSPYCLSIADLARLLGSSRQTARTFVLAAVREGLVELEPNSDDRRLLQLAVTPRGRAELQAAESREAAWLIVLLHGLGDRDMATTTRVLTVIRQRLERDARELARGNAIPLKS
jgi:DNA-binding MarR family transcriptional regulator